MLYTFITIVQTFNAGKITADNFSENMLTYTFQQSTKTGHSLGLPPVLCLPHAALTGSAQMSVEEW